MKWIQNVVKSVYDPAYYRDIVSGKETGSFAYFFILMVALSILTAIPSYISFSSWISRPDGFSSFRDSITNLYPDGLVLMYGDGHVTSNAEEPYKIPMPGALRSSSSDANGKTTENLLVIDTTHTIVPEDFAKYDTAAILGNTSIWTNDPQKGIQVNTFENWNKDPFTLDKGTVTGFIDKVSGFLRPILIAGVVLLPVFFFAAFSIGYLSYLLFGALLVLIVGKIRNVELSYGQSYRVGLHLITVPAFYGLVIGIFPVLDVRFVFSAMLVIFAVINLVPVKAVSTEAKVEEV